LLIHSTDSFTPFPILQIVVASGEGGLWHRFCCHNLLRCTSEWKSPADRVAAHQQKVLEETGGKKCLESKPKQAMSVWDFSSLEAKLKNAERVETNFNNLPDDPRKSFSL
jgi:hypothetical protein